MGHQTEFVASHSLVDRFEQWFRGLDGGVALAQPTASADLLEAPSLRPELAGGVRPWSEVLLVRRADLGHVRVKFVEAQGYYLVDKSNSPVVEFFPRYEPATGQPRPDMPGRIWFSTSYLDEQGHLVRPPEDFIAWGDRLIRWLRRNGK